MFLFSQLPEEIIEEIVRIRMSIVNKAATKIQVLANNKFKFKQRTIFKDMMLGIGDIALFEFSINYTCTLIRLFSKVRPFLVNKNCYFDVSAKASAHFIYRYEENDPDYDERVIRMCKLGKIHGILF